MASKTVTDRVSRITLEKVTGSAATCDVAITSSEGAITDGRLDLTVVLTAQERTQLLAISTKLIAAASARDGFV